MITLEGTQLEYPSTYNFDYSPVRGKHAVLNQGYKRYSKNAKHSISLGWTTITKEQAQIIIDLYESQFVNWNTLTFVFEGARMGEDLGPIEVFAKLETNKILIGNRREIALTLYER